MKAMPPIRASLLGAGSLLAVALLAGRLSGLARELTLAATFGVSLKADVAVLLLTIPDLLVNILLAGGLSAALVPRLRGLPEAQAGQLFRRTAGWVLLTFSLLAAFVAVAPKVVFTILAPGIPSAVNMLTDSATGLVALSIPLTALSGVSGAYLNARDRFFIAGLGTLIFNVVIVATLLGSLPIVGLATLAAAILAGATIRLLSQMAILPRSAFHFRQGRGQGSSSFAAAFAAGIAASSFTLLPVALIRAGASLLGSGNVALFNYAQKLVELPVGILITTISTVALSRLSLLYSEGRNAEAQETLIGALRIALFLGVMIVIFGTVAADPAIRLVFLRGAVTQEDVGAISKLFQIILLGVPFVAFSSLAMAALNARLLTTQVFRATVISVAFLPILALPGLYLSSGRMLMAAVVGSQIILALVLSKSAGLRALGSQGVLDRKSAKTFLYGLLTAAVAVVMMRFVSVENDIITLVLAGLGFISASAMSLIISKKQDSDPKAEESISVDAVSPKIRRPKPSAAAAKRAIDIFIAVVALAMLSLPMLIVALAIKVSSGGPALYRQTRVGRDCRAFTMMKFRSMVVDAETVGGYATVANDARITPLGHFLRRTSLDELPQLFNVLLGDMSIVGPRPDVPAQEHLYPPEVWRMRHVVRPGITGLAQAISRSAAGAEARTELDLAYIHKFSLFLDLKIIFMTFSQLTKKNSN